LRKLKERRAVNEGKEGSLPQPQEETSDSREASRLKKKKSVFDSLEIKGDKGTLIPHG